MRDSDSNIYMKSISVRKTLIFTSGLYMQADIHMHTHVCTTHIQAYIHTHHEVLMGC